MNAVKRPKALLLLGWTTIVFGAFCTVGGVAASGAALELWDAGGVGRPLETIDYSLALVFGVLSLLGVLLAVAGWGLLRLQLWAARVVRTAAWSTVVYAGLVTAGALSILLRFGDRSQLPTALGIGAAIIAIAAIPPVLITRYLRQREEEGFLQ